MNIIVKLLDLKWIFYRDGDLCVFILQMDILLRC